jgi:carbon starvation protein
VVPVWLLLQPRGHLGGFFLYAALLGGALGLVFGGNQVQYPAFTHWTTERGESLVPMLFITIACGACSGFHALIASGTTSKQLRKETDARVIGYGSMLLEGMVAVVSLCCVMILAAGSSTTKASPNLIYALGLGSFLAALKIPIAFAVSFALMAFTTFVYDTLDVCTRLGRYIVQELTGWHDRRGKWLGTLLTAGVPLFFLLRGAVGPDGKPVPVWRTFWSLFGASNQLLAALTLLGVTVWLWRTRGTWWVWVVTGLPTLWMYVMSTWALFSLTAPKFYEAFRSSDGVRVPLDPVPWVGAVLLCLAGLMLLEALRILFGTPQPPSPGYALAQQPAAQ